MELFNIVVGIATIISTICSIYSVFVLSNLYDQIKNWGDDNVNSIQKNYGIKNKNKITNTITNKK